MVAGAARIRVTYQVDADGLLSVNAQEKTTNVEASVTVKPSYGLSDGDIERMLKESYEHARGDMRARALAEQRVEGQRLLEAVRAAIAADGTLLQVEERAPIEEGIAALQALLGGTEHRAIKAAIEALNHATEEFAGKRMDAGVRRALAGKQIANFDV